MISTIQPSAAARLRVAGYLLLLTMAVLPLLDVITVGWPVRVGQVQWRFAAFGQLSASAGAPLLAILGLYALAYLSGDKRMLYLSSLIAAAYAVLLIAALASFPLDTLQMRRRVPAGAQPRFTLMAGVAVLRLGFYCLSAIALVISQFRSARMVSAAESEEAHPSKALVMRNLSGPLRPTPTATAAQPVTTQETETPAE